MNKSTSDIIPFYKPVGLTPAQAIDDFRRKNPKYRNEAISHAGKLDPLAQGLLLLVTGRLTLQKNLKKFLKLDKVYNARILFGIKSDSYDIQGVPLISRTDMNKNIEIDLEKLKSKILSLKGEYLQELPVFSGRKVNGKPLYYYARKNLLDKINIPKEKVEIKDIKINKIFKISSEELLKQIINKIDLLDGDFRQDEIKEKWKILFKDIKRDFLVIDVTISCSSGTYIRSLANNLGKEYSGGLLIELLRQKIGNYDLGDVKRQLSNIRG
ncbi:MAG: hypothetical protein Q8N99_06930 [Nanoarchaeota archaeon]|nr:hypothetical protein [Nanoarchaeota archaeon]